MHHIHLHHGHLVRPTPKTFSVYLAVLFLSFHYFFIIYINSTFLSQYINESKVGLIYVIGSILGITSLVFAHRILGRIGNFKLLTSLIIGEMICLITLAYATNPIIVILAFIGQHVFNPFMLYCFDIILDTYSSKQHQGRSRGMFLTVLNTPPIIATLITGYILNDHNFSDIYTLSALFIIPTLFITFSQFRTFEDPPYKKTQVIKALSRIKSHRLVRNILIDNVVLQIFYSIMTIYLPLYLQTKIGFSLSEITLMFSIMLLPFAILQLPVGKIADEMIGEKELLIGGFILMGVAMLIIGWVTLSSFWIWTALLFLTRIGAAIVEITTESYFFKHVDPTDADLIGIFRMAHPIAFIVMPIIGTIVLNYVAINNIFTIGASVILIVGLRYAFDLRDTR